MPNSRHCMKLRCSAHLRGGRAGALHNGGVRRHMCARAALRASPPPPPPSRPSPAFTCALAAPLLLPLPAPSLPGTLGRSAAPAPAPPSPAGTLLRLLEVEVPGGPCTCACGGFAVSFQYKSPYKGRVQGHARALAGGGRAGRAALRVRVWWVCSQFQVQIAGARAGSCMRACW